MNENKTLALGIDVGSTTVKVVLLEGEDILYQEYQRHMSQVRPKTLELLRLARDVGVQSVVHSVVKNTPPSLAGIFHRQGGGAFFLRRVARIAAWEIEKHR